MSSTFACPPGSHRREAPLVPAGDDDPGHAVVAGRTVLVGGKRTTVTVPVRPGVTPLPFASTARTTEATLVVLRDRERR
jgi:hypothetical protein